LTNNKTEVNSIAINEAQLLLAEKRTSLAIATSKYYDVLHVLYFLVPLGILNLALIVFGAYLIIRSIVRMRHYDRLIHEIKLKHSVIGEFID